ncbi:uncharacterized protein LOC134540552 isoform X1 [Bacillus rossius redtenbacheri]|uniref:uncharacterized protein LOC134540552 isoform X1 n=1 Tax=Bacillus rossius redtenbacheri TaxID=93214 RepID=UPI002FDDB836
MDFYYHLTTHTGEYDFECDSCSYCSSNILGVRNHNLLHHNGFSRTVALNRGPSHIAKFMYGYLCSVCNFLQLLKENVEKHMALRHQKDESAKIFRINMSIPLEESTKEVTSGNKCSSDTLRIADEQESHNETHNKSIEDVAEDSVNNVSTNMEKPISGSQSKRITSENVPASMNPVVVLKDTKRLIKKGRNSSGPKAVDAVTEHVSQDEGSVDERNAAREENAMEEDDIADDASKAEVCENQTDLNDVQKLPSEMTVNQVTTAESSAKSVDVSADSNSNSNESFDAETSSTARAEDFITEVAETPQQPVDEATSVNSDSAENPGPQEDTNISSQAVESELQDSCVSATAVEGVAPDTNRAVTDKDSTEKVGQFLGMDVIAPGKTGDKSPEIRETVPFKRSSSLLERIEFLCAQSNASEKQIEANPVNKLAKTDSSKAKKKLAENAERSSITTRASTTAQKQVSCLENSDVSRVAVENDGALIRYSLSAKPVSSAYLESVVPSERNDSVSRDHPRADTSDNLADNSESATANPPEHNYQAVVSPLLGMDTIAIKQDNLEPGDIGTEGSDSGGLELYDITSMPDPSVSSICIGPMEAKNEGGRILFCCRISGCHFQCSQVVKFACHYNTEHDKAWDGFCVLCGEVIDGIAPYCLEQAVEHLLSFHLTSKLKQKNLSGKGKAKTRRPSATQRTNKVVRSSCADSTTAGVTTTTASSVVATSACVTASNVTYPSSSPSTSATAVPATGGSSFADTQAVADLLKNAVLIKNEPLDAEEAGVRDDEARVRDDEAREARVGGDGDEGREPERESPVKSPGVQAPDARPRIRVRRISGDRLSVRTEEAQEPPAGPTVSPEEVQPKVERTDDGEYEQPAAVDKDVSSDVASKPSSALWPELSPAVCDESVLENSTGRCSPVLWGEGGKTVSPSRLCYKLVWPAHELRGGEASNSFPSIRIVSVVSLNPEANKQDDSAAGSRSPSGGGVTKKPCSRLVALGSTPQSAVRPKVKAPARQPQPSVSPSRVAVIKPLGSEARRKDAAPAQKTTTAQRSVKSSKSPDAYRAMLEPARLQRLFKCMHPTCEFATGAEARFVAHARVHERALGPAARARLQDWNRCAYCCEACATAGELVAHVVREHGYCLYQCAYCFFRAMSPTYVLLHQKSSHVREAVAIIIDQRRRKMPELKDFPDKRENRKSVVLPYVCAQGTCGARFYPCEDYLTHLKTVHTQVTIYSCHLCECKSMKPDALLSHYKWHSLNQYQCMYCLHGADSAIDMKHHLCTFHSDQPNRAIIRIFQDYTHHSHRQVEDLLTIDLDEGMDYTNLFVQCADDEEDRGDVPPPAPAPAPAKPPINLEGHDLFHCCNKGCIHTAGTLHELRDHLSVCDSARESAVLECAHCGKRLKAIASLVEHLQSHGFKATVSAVVERHCRQLHRYPATRVEPVNADSMWFVVRPRDKRRAAKGAKGPEKKSYEPKDIHKLPDKDIFKEQVSCSMCSFATKVRVNMVRHLEMHEAEKRSAGSAVRSSCPVNPVPCLNRAEMMFDKMENLAASSQAMLGADSHPGFVPERFRYVCGAPGCHYMGCDEDMLRMHVRTLHAGETDYVCTHCGRAVGVGADLAGVLEHLRMHGGRLYRCTYCAFSHYTVAQVEQHSAARHPDQPVLPVIIRKVVD